jgi:Protein of unknown function (DUF2652)
LDRLHLKVIAHHGQAVFKHVRGFEELAGLDVILAHRLLKNTVQLLDYVLLTEAFWRASGGVPGAAPDWRTEQAEGIGPVPVAVLGAELSPALERSRPPMTRLGGILELVRLTIAGVRARMTRRGRVFAHLPPG